MAKEKTEATGAETATKVKVIAKTGMWRGGIRWEAGLNEVDALVLLGTPEGATKTVRALLEQDPGGNFTIL